MGFEGSERIPTIYLAVLTQYRSVTDEVNDYAIYHVLHRG